MEISEVELHEFRHRLEDVGKRRRPDGRHDGESVYVPDSTMEPMGYVLTIRTADGLEGHYKGFMRALPATAQIKMVAHDFLLGRDPLEREQIWGDLWHVLRHTDHMGVGPIDIALWDLAGKYYDESIAALLGGFRDHAPAYASTTSGNPEYDTPESYAAFAEECYELGYPGFKIHPLGDPDLDIDVCRAVAETVGDRMDLMLDPSSMYETYTDTLRVGRVLDELGFLWYEDPMMDTGESTYMSMRLARDLDTPILGIEHSRTEPFGSVNHLMAESLDMVRADAHLGGGITGVMKIARTVESFGMDVELHMAGPSHLHCISAIRNTNYYEHGLVHPDIGFEWLTDQGYADDIHRLEDDGMKIPDGPGLGVEIDWDFIEDRQVDHTVIDPSTGGGLDM